MTPYSTLITSARLRETSKKGRDLKDEVRSDGARITTSTAFRRLQTKAQVFSLEQNAAVRTRLTHTLEVAMYGEIIARKVFDKLKSSGYIDEEMRVPFTKSVENACLLHDIGNPPFGHLGEFSIKDWFADETTKDRITDRWAESDVARNDITKNYASFEYFDGNPQGFRYVTRLQWLRDGYGLNLTCTLLASILKYLDTEPNNSETFNKKTGFFETERDKVLRIWDMLGLRVQNNLPAQRHPITFLMEAADDIAYCLSDIEDAIEKGVISERFFHDQLDDEVEGEFWPDNPYKSSEDNVAQDANFKIFKIEATNYLTEKVSEIYLDKHPNIIDGSIQKPLLQYDERSRQLLDNLKEIAGSHIFTSKEAVNVEVSGHQIIQQLLEDMMKLLHLSSQDFKSLIDVYPGVNENVQKPLEERLATLLPYRHSLAYKHMSEKCPVREPIYRTHLIVDYIAGMTDSHAVKVYNMLQGISANETV
jgi:dGTPase